MGIPKTFHRIVIGEPPGEVEQHWRRFQELHPGWQFNTWTPPFPEHTYELGRFFSQARHPAQLADLLRLEILWREGGVYVDWDTEPLRSFDPLVEAFPFFAGAEDGSAVATGIIGAEAGSPILRACMDRLLEWDRLPVDVPINVVTGPLLLTRVLAEFPDAAILPPEVFYPISYRGGVPRFDPHRTYAVHRYHGSWVDPQESSLRHRIQAWPKRSLARLRATARAGVARGKEVVARTPPVGRHNHATAVGDGRVLVSTTLGLPMYAVASDLSITPELVTRGCYDEAFIRFLQRHLRPGDHVVDVGANVGFFTLAMAQCVGRTGRVHAFEPNPSTAPVLRQNVAMNWFEDRVRVYDFALGEHEGTVSLNVSSSFLGCSGRADLGEGSEFEGRRVELVQVSSKRLDDVLNTASPIRLVKVDVEGGESHVLQGMWGLLEAKAVRMLDVEVLRATARKTWPDLVRLLRSLVNDLGARPHRVRSVGDLQPVSLDWVVCSEAAQHLVCFRPSVGGTTSMAVASVIIPVLNAADLLEQQFACLERQQTDVDWEVIVVDNGSTDHLHEVVSRWEGRLPHLRLVDGSERPGCGAARNVGCHEARGSFLLFCDADDLVSPGWVDGYVRTLANYHYATGPVQRLRHSEHVGPTIWESVDHRFFSDGPPMALGKVPFPSGGNSGFRAEVLTEIGGFDTENLFGEDLSTGIRARLRGFRMGWSEQSKVLHRERPDFRGLWRQSFAWGVGRVFAARQFPEFAVSYRQHRRLLRRCVWQLLHLWHIALPARRHSWIKANGYLCGELIELALPEAYYRRVRKKRHQQLVQGRNRSTILGEGSPRPPRAG